MLGWLLDPTFSVPLPGCSLPGDVGFLEVLEASDLSLPVNCLPVRSMVIQHVDSNMLLKTAPKNHVRCQGGGRHQDGSSSRQGRERPGMHKDFNVISISFKGVLARRVVITKYYE